jgi:hypothetical protein
MSGKKMGGKMAVTLDKVPYLLTRVRNRHMKGNNLNI